MHLPSPSYTHLYVEERPRTKHSIIARTASEGGGYASLRNIHLQREDATATFIIGPYLPDSINSPGWRTFAFEDQGSTIHLSTYLPVFISIRSNVESCYINIYKQRNHRINEPYICIIKFH